MHVMFKYLLGGAFLHFIAGSQEVLQVGSESAFLLLLPVFLYDQTAGTQQFNSKQAPLYCDVCIYFCP